MEQELLRTQAPLLSSLARRIGTWTCCVESAQGSADFRNHMDISKLDLHRTLSQTAPTGLFQRQPQKGSAFLGAPMEGSRAPSQGPSGPFPLNHTQTSNGWGKGADRTHSSVERALLILGPVFCRGTLLALPGEGVLTLPEAAPTARVYFFLKTWPVGFSEER